MTKTDRDREARFEQHCVWNKTPTTGTTFEGLLFGAVALYMVAAIGVALYPDPIPLAANPQYQAAVPSLYDEA